MSERDIRALEAIETEVAEVEQERPLVEINYPRPTPISTVLKDVARWSGLSFVMEPSANCEIQIFAPRRLPPEEAYELFLASLSVVGLRAVQVGPAGSSTTVVKIVPMQMVTSA